MSTYGKERQRHLEALVTQLAACGMSGRLIGEDDPILWAWHPQTRRQVMVFATPSNEGWFYLWAPDGRENADNPGMAAEAIRRRLTGP